MKLEFTDKFRFAFICFSDWNISEAAMFMKWTKQDIMTYGGYIAIALLESMLVSARTASS